MDDTYKTKVSKVDWNGREARPPFINKMKDHVKIWTKSTEKVKIHPQRPNPE